LLAAFAPGGRHSRGHVVQVLLLHDRATVGGRDGVRDLARGRGGRYRSTVRAGDRDDGRRYDGRRSGCGGDRAANVGRGGHRRFRDSADFLGGRGVRADRAAGRSGAGGLTMVVMMMVTAGDGGGAGERRGLYGGGRSALTRGQSRNVLGGGLWSHRRGCRLDQGGFSGTSGGDGGGGGGRCNGCGRDRNDYRGSGKSHRGLGRRQLFGGRHCCGVDGEIRCRFSLSFRDDGCADSCAGCGGSVGGNRGGTGRGGCGAGRGDFGVRGGYSGANGGLRNATHVRRIDTVGVETSPGRRLDRFERDGHLLRHVVATASHHFGYRLERFVVVLRDSGHFDGVVFQI